MSPMKKLYAILVTFVVTLFASSAFAWDPPPSPAPISWISDPSHVLSDAAHSRLDAKLKQINQSSANEIAALILPTLDGENIADVGDLTAKSWGVGKKGLDNGVLVVLAMKEHKSRISTGKGVEGDLPDLKCNDILQSARPYLRKGDVEGALGFIFDSSSSAIANHKAEAASGHTTSSGPNCDVSGGVGLGSGSIWLLVLTTGGLLLLWNVLRSNARKRREQEELERQQREERARQRRLSIERETARRAEEVRLNKPAPPVTQTPVQPRPVAHAPLHHNASVAVPVAATVVAVAAEEEARRHRAEEVRRRREREEEEARRRRREREEEDHRRSESSSSSSSSSSFDWGGSSGGSGGFGGGDFGGGGGSSDW